MFVAGVAATERTLVSDQAEEQPVLTVTSRFGWFRWRAAHGGKSRSSCMMRSSKNLSLSAIEFGGNGTGRKTVRAPDLKKGHPHKCTVANSQVVLDVLKSAFQRILISGGGVRFGVQGLFCSQG